MPPDNTPQHRNDALNKLAEEEREMAKSEPKFGEWLPIETAPKDNTEVLIYEAGERPSITTARRAEDGPIYHNGCTKGIYDDPMEFLPTHWMPLPAPPKEKP